MRMLLADETLFRDAELFEPDHLPEEFLYRDSELRTLSFCLRPALAGKKPINAFLFGKPATGKTTSIRKIFQLFEEKSNKVVFVHVNCKLYDTEFKVFSLIHKAVLGYEPPETGVPLTTVYANIFNALKNKVLLVALDDITPSKTANEVLYKILRAHEIYDVKTSVFCVSQNDIMHKLDEKVRSVFRPERIEYREYTKEQIHEILKTRVKLGLYDKVLSEGLLKKIALASQDLRHGIELIKVSALHAECEASRKINEEHIKKAFGSPSKKHGLIKKIPPAGIESGALFKKIDNMSYTKFYRTLQKLKTKGLIDITRINKKKGRTSLIKRK